MIQRSMSPFLGPMPLRYQLFKIYLYVSVYEAKSELVESRFGTNIFLFIIC